MDCLTKPTYEKKLVVILAGYETQIHQLLRVNPGLSSRFPASFDFANLTPLDCVSLLETLLRQQNAKFDSLGEIAVDLLVPRLNDI